MKTKSSEPNILLDSDVIRHFIKGDSLSILPKIFPGRFVILDIVKNELCRSPHLITVVTSFITIFKIPEIPFPSDKNVLKEYGALKKLMDDGESACLAYALFNKNFIASSNITQIKKYCETNNIKYYTTMDLLVVALENGIMSEFECDEFIRKVLLKGSKLPCSLISEYIKNKSK